ncbi:g2291 [Coccomyxa elongata]
MSAIYIAALLATSVLLAGAQVLPKKKVVDHVLVYLVDGLHVQDLDNYIAEFPYSNIAALANTGTKYENYFLPPPTDSWPALATQITGGGPQTHGIIYESPYSRGLYPPGSKCVGNPGTVCDFSEDSNSPPTLLYGAKIDPSILPLNKSAGCTPVYPNNFITSNTMFSVATQAGLKTAWSDKAIQYTFVAGPGNPTDLSDRITDTNFPVIDYLINKKDIPSQMEYDLLHLDAVLSWIKGTYSNGTASDGKPWNLFGTSLQSVNAAQKSADTQVNNLPVANPTNTYLSGGYGDPNAIPNDPSKNSAANPATNTQIAAFLNKNNVNNDQNDWFLAEVHAALAGVDDIVGQTVNALKDAGIYEKTAIVFGSKHGNSPINNTALVRVNFKDVITAINTAIAPASVASSNADTGGYVWLTDSSPATVAKAVAALTTPAALAKFNTAQVLSGDQLTPILGSNPDRVPDLFVVPKEGTLYSTSKTKVSDHGGEQSTDTHISLIISNPNFPKTVVTDTVSGAQLAPTLLDLLGLDYSQLTGVQVEGTKPLPGLPKAGSLTTVAGDVADAVTKPVGAEIAASGKLVHDALTGRKL